MNDTHKSTSDATLGRYVLLGELGSGGMGDVHRARDEKLEREVALKVLPAHWAEDRERLARFQREARSLASLQHPNIVQVFSVEEHDDVHFFTMELVRGRTLREVLDGGPMSEDALLELFLPLCDAIAAAHDQGIVHRDLKPRNVMLDEHGRVKVLDFGLAKHERAQDDELDGDQSTATMTAAGRVMGTVAYMSPEQAEGKEVGPPSDVFSLGVMLYEAACGVRPFEGETSLAILTSMLRDEPLPLHQRRKELSKALSTTVERCLAKHPKDRFATAKELHDALLAGTDPATRQGPSTGLRRAGWLVGAAAAVALVAALGYSFSNQGASAPASSAATASSDSAGPVRAMVLPFENLSKDPADDWLGVGLAEAVQTKLGATRSLQVLAFQGKKTSADGDSSAGDLGVDVLVKGSFQKVGSRLRVAVRVERAAQPGVASFTAEEQGEMDAIFDVQDTLAARLARAIAPHGSDTDEPSLEKSIRQRGTRDLGAFEAFAKGLAYLDAGKVPEALRSFDEAMKKDPSFREAETSRRRMRAQMNHLLFKKDGTVVSTRRQETSGLSYQHGTNTGRITRAWDAEGKPLPIKETPVDDGFRYVIAHPHLVDGGTIYYEQERRAAAAPKSGLRLTTAQFSEIPAGPRTFVLQMPAGAQIVSMLPLASRVVLDASATVLMLRQDREQHARYGWSILYFSDPASAEPFLEMRVGERIKWLQDNEVADEQRARWLARAVESNQACLASAQGDVAEAERSLATIERDPRGYGTFLAALARSCVARARGDDRSAFSELESALRAEVRPRLMVQDAYDAAIEVASEQETRRLADVVLGELAAQPWWTEQPFHLTHREGARTALEGIVARNPDNDAARLDLARIHMAAGRLREADAVLAKRDEGTARVFLFAMRLRVALAQGDTDEAKRMLRHLVLAMPFEPLWGQRVVTMAEAGRVEEAIEALENRVEKGFEEEEAATLVSLVYVMQEPLQHDAALEAIFDRAPELAYQGPFRFHLAGRLLSAVVRGRCKDKPEAAKRWFDRLRETAKQTPAALCDQNCYRRSAPKLCLATELPKEARRWIESKTNQPCRAERKAP